MQIFLPLDYPFTLFDSLAGDCEQIKKGKLDKSKIRLSLAQSVQAKAYSGSAILSF